MEREVFREQLLEDGFTTDEIFFDDLGVFIPSHNDRYFKELVVPKPIEDANNFIEKYFKNLNFKRAKSEVFGVSGEFYKKGITVYPIFISDGLTSENYIDTRGHERGHILEWLGMERVIFQKSRNPQKVEEELHLEEDFPILCGMIALRNKGYNIGQIGPPTIPIWAEKVKSVFLEYFR